MAVSHQSLLPMKFIHKRSKSRCKTGWGEQGRETGGGEGRGEGRRDSFHKRCKSRCKKGRGREGGGGGEKERFI